MFAFDPVRVREAGGSGVLVDGDSRLLEIGAQQRGITAGEPLLDYPRLLVRVQEVTSEVRSHS